MEGDDMDGEVISSKEKMISNNIPNGCLKSCANESANETVSKRTHDNHKSSSHISGNECNRITDVANKLCGIADDNGSNSYTKLQNTEQGYDHELCDNLAAVHLPKANGSNCNTTLLSELKPSTSDLPQKPVVTYVVYESEKQMPFIMQLITKDLSEPYSIYTYRYFIHNWPKLCFLAMDGEKCVGAIVCKLDMHKKMARRGYIAMLAIDQNYRRRGIGSHLVMKAIKAMVADDCDEVVLETEITNKAALRLYENLGFVRDKRLFRYYLNGVDALRLKLWLR